MLRVVAGTLRGRRFRAPRGLATRPTTDRVREALFQILGDLSGSTVVDLYAGSGSLGIEALSRGALHATFVESDRVARRVLSDNIERLDLGARATIVARRVERAAPVLVELGPFDLVLCDPPWRHAQAAARRVERIIVALASAEARIVLGHPAAEPVALAAGGPLVVVERRRWGKAGLTFCRKAQEYR